MSLPPTTTTCANCGDCETPFLMTLPDPLSPGEWIHPDGCPNAAMAARLAALGDDALALESEEIAEVLGAVGGAGDPRLGRGWDKKRKELQDLYETSE